jgi:hypothetical protein
MLDPDGTGARFHALDVPVPHQRKDPSPAKGNGPELVGVGRFELPASSSRTKRAAKLRHTPPVRTTRSVRDFASLAETRACSCTAAQVPGPDRGTSRDRATPG